MNTNQRIAKMIADETFDMIERSRVRSILKGDVERAAFKALAVVEADAASGGLISAVRAAGSGDTLRDAAGALLKELDRSGLRRAVLPIDLSTAIHRLERAVLQDHLK